MNEFVRLIFKPLFLRGGQRLVDRLRKAPHPTEAGARPLYDVPFTRLGSCTLYLVLSPLLIYHAEVNREDMRRLGDLLSGGAGGIDFTVRGIIEVERGRLRQI